MKFFIIALAFISINSCNGQSCDILKKSFGSYNEAINLIQKTDFNFKDQINTSKSSWIIKARYYSCDKSVGYFILKTSKKNYIFKNIPIKVWEGFKRAKSCGTFYNDFIRGKYKILLEK